MPRTKTVLLFFLTMTMNTLTAVSHEIPAVADRPCTLAQYGEGTGPHVDRGVYRLLDGAKNQANTIGFTREQEGAFRNVDLSCKLRIPEGAEGGFFAFLDTKNYASSGPAPYLPMLEEPGFKNSFALGIDVSDPPNTDWFQGPGNFYGRAEREVSLHWNEREIVKRLSEVEFRGSEFIDWIVSVNYVIGGAEITVQIADYKIFDGYFIPSMQPYEFRLAMGARIGERTTEFNVKDLSLTATGRADPKPGPVSFNLFNYVQTTQSEGTFSADVDLPPESWAFGRVIMKIRIHGGSRWDEWDRCAHVSVGTEDGGELKIVSFITSYKTPCYFEVDVTDFRSLLAGQTRFFLHAGTIYKDKGFLMSVELDYHLGKPDLYAYKVVPLWCGTIRYQSDADPFGGFYGRRTIDIEEKTVAARLHLVHTGHNQVGEFTPAARTLKCDEVAFENVLWRDDCYLNPNRPQYGTWKFSRAGWAPGDICHPWLIDVSSCLEPGKPAVFQYIPQKYEFEAGEEQPDPETVSAATHIVSSYLILYEEPVGLVDAPTVMIYQVSPDSAALRAGLQAGDYLFSYDGIRLFSRDDMDSAKKQALAAEKKTVKLVVYRGSERMEIDFPTGQMGISLGTR
ncbi:MAG: peptide-N-glycosidase F-related protein [Planctomycetota bacterium]